MSLCSRFLVWLLGFYLAIQSLVMNFLRAFAFALECVSLFIGMFIGIRLLTHAPSFNRFAASVFKLLSKKRSSS
jgi:hypothetical protein